MCLVTDKKFLNMVSPMLQRFAWKKSNLANCRCPYCGDSKKKKTKTRGYFYIKNNDIFFKCHNCGVGTTMYKFLEFVAPAVCKEYALERWRNGETGHSNYKKPELSLQFEKPKTQNKNILSELESVDTLPDNHICKQFVIDRKIPQSKWKNLFYTQNFCKLIDKHSKEPCNQTFKTDERLVIPIFDRNGELLGMQGRALDKKSSVRYLTLKLVDSLDSVWYGIENINYNETVYIVEGPIDSLFLPNCVAMIGLNTEKIVPNNISNFVYVLDNEPRNKEVLSYYESVIENGQFVVIWPETIKKKDINDMIMNNIHIDEILNTIKNNTFNGIEAKMRFIKWKKI